MNDTILDTLKTENDYYKQLKKKDKFSFSRWRYYNSWNNFVPSILIGGNKFSNYINGVSLKDFIKDEENLKKLMKFGANTREEIIQYVNHLQDTFEIEMNKNGEISTFRPIKESSNEKWQELELFNDESDNKQLFVNCMLEDGLLSFDYKKWWKEATKVFGKDLIHPIQLLKIKPDYYNAEKNKYGDSSYGAKTINSLSVPMWLWDVMDLTSLQYTLRGKTKKVEKMTPEQIEKELKNK